MKHQMLGKGDPKPEIMERVQALLDCLRPPVDFEQLKVLTAKRLPLGDLPVASILFLVVGFWRAGQSETAADLLVRLLRRIEGFAPEQREHLARLALSANYFEGVLKICEASSADCLRYVTGLAAIQLQDFERWQISGLNKDYLLDRLEKDPAWIPEHLWWALMLPGLTDKEHQPLANRFAHHLRSGIEPYIPLVEQLRVRGKLRIGWLSGDIRQHPCNHLARPLLAALDRSRYELIAFDNSPDDGSIERGKMLAVFDHVIPVRGKSDSDVAAVIRDKAINILVDMAGHTTHSRSAILAFRPAPVSIAWLGYAGTLGRGLADYLIVDTHSAPEGCDRYFAEALIRWPLSYIPGGDPGELGTRMEPSQLGLPDGAPVLACFNQLMKWTPESIARWCRLMHAIPKAVLWLPVPEMRRQAVRQLFASRGIDSERLIFAEWAARNDHLTRLQSATLALDTHPYGMHTTAVDALAAGLPFLTYRGNTLAGRVTSALLASAGLGDCVYNDAEALFKAELALLEDDARYTLLRKRFAQARSSILFDAENYAQLFGQTFEKIWDRSCAGLPSEGFNVDWLPLR